MSMKVIAIDGVSGVGKTTFCEYVKRNKKHPVIIGRSLCESDFKKGWECNFFGLLAWHAKKGDEIVFVDRSPASYEVYQGKLLNDSFYQTIGLLRHSNGVQFFSVHFVTNLAQLKKNKGGDLEDYHGLTSKKAMEKYKKCTVFGKGWDMTVDADKYYGKHRNTLYGRIMRKVEKL